jgi:hypothetical protein
MPIAKQLIDILGDDVNRQHRAFGQALRLQAGPGHYGLDTTHNLSDHMWIDQTFSLSFWVYLEAFGSVIPERGTGLMATRLATGNYFDANQTGSGRMFTMFGPNFVALMYNVELPGSSVFNGIYFQTPQIQLGRWIHVAICHDGQADFADSAGFVNSLQIAKNISYTPLPSINHTTRPTGLAADWTANNDRTSSRYADLIIANKYLSPAEVRVLFNNATNDPTKYASHYPPAVLAARELHLPLSTGQYGVTGGGQLQALDVSGNNRHLDILGQGTTPGLVNFY